MKVCINHKLIFYWRNLYSDMFLMIFPGNVKTGFKDTSAAQSGIIFCQITPKEFETDKASLDPTNINKFPSLPQIQ